MFACSSRVLEATRWSSQWGVVASQDCDIVQSDQVEPHVEVLEARLVSKPNKSIWHGRHPRQLQFETNVIGEYIELDIRRRAFLDKALLCDIQAEEDRSLDVAQVRVMARWIGKRYTRDAFPDAFNERCRVQSAKLDRLSKSDASRHITAIYFQLNHPREELSDDRDYEVDVWFACRPEALRDADIALSIDEFMTRFTELMNACRGIVVVDSVVKALDEITLADAGKLKRFDYDFRSIAPKPGGELPPEVP